MHRAAWDIDQSKILTRRELALVVADAKGIRPANTLLA